jgi:hypothetical protein
MTALLRHCEERSDAAIQQVCAKAASKMELWVASSSLRGAKRQSNPAGMAEGAIKKKYAGLLRCRSQ